MYIYMIKMVVERVCSLKQNRRRPGEQCDLVTGDSFSFV